MYASKNVEWILPAQHQNADGVWGSGRVMIEGGSVIRAGMVEKASPISVGNGFVWLRAFAHTGRDSSLPGGVLMVERGV